MKHIPFALLGSVLLYAALSSPAGAAVSAEEAAKLRTTLTPMGAERAGNKDGTIPAWTGGFTQVPPGYKSGQPRPDFFASEKPVLQITGKNFEQYADKLSETSKALLRKHPDYRLDVYPTHRTAAAPAWVYENTFKNATQATTTNNGDVFADALGGIPFPIPKDGAEVLWNHRTAWRGESFFQPLTAWIVTAQGKRVMMERSDEFTTFPYYYRDMTPQAFDGVIQKAKLLTQEPAAKSGEGLLTWEAADQEKSQVWQYLVGQRRVRRAPSMNYDTPNFVNAGIGFIDETFGVLGPMQRHDLRIIGKREMYVPYNANKAAAASIEQLMGPKFLNPDLVRWELHRVWEVEATLRAGKRHAVPKRRYYVDEDTWAILMADGWDAKGELWHGYMVLPLLAPDVPAVVANAVNWGGINVQTGEYYIGLATNGQSVQYEIKPRQPASFYSPEGLASEGSR